MKKIILSSLVVLSFATYVIFKKNLSATDTVPVTAASSEGRSTSSQSETTPDTSPITPVPTQASSSDTLQLPQPTTAPVASGRYKDGSYTGSVTDAFYGYLQVRAVISGGKLTDVTFLRYPDDRGESIRINEQAIPYLKEEAIAAQSAKVDIVSGATDSSEAFVQSLQSALDQAKS